MIIHGIASLSVTSSALLQRHPIPVHAQVGNHLDRKIAFHLMDRRPPEHAIMQAINADRAVGGMNQPYFAHAGAT